MSDPGTSISHRFTAVERNPFIRPGGQPTEAPPLPQQEPLPGSPQAKESSYLPSREAEIPRHVQEEPSMVSSFSSAWRSALRKDGISLTEKDTTAAEKEPGAPEESEAKETKARPLFSRQQVGRIDKSLSREEKMQDNLHTQAENLSSEARKGIMDFMDKTMTAMDKLRHPALPQLPGSPPSALRGTEKPAQPQARDRNTRTHRADIPQFEETLQKELGENGEVTNRGDIDSLQGDIPSVRELKELFGNVKKDPTLPWEYLQDGCYSRAHETSRRIMEKGYNCSKLFACIDDRDFEDPAKRLQARNNYTKGEWQYHVAPLVFARDEKTGAVEGYLVDPSTHPEGPVKAKEWLGSMWKGTTKIYLDVTHPDAVTPRPPGSSTGPRDFSREEFDRFMPETTAANRDFADVLAYIKERHR